MIYTANIHGVDICGKKNHRNIFFLHARGLNEASKKCGKMITALVAKNIILRANTISADIGYGSTIKEDIVVFKRKGRCRESFPTGNIVINNKWCRLS